MSVSTELDREVESLYRAGSKPRLVEVPTLSYLMVDGRGDPNSEPRYQQAIEALYSTAYACKFALKRIGGPAYKVGPLEGLWWAPDASVFHTGDRSAWLWTIMVRQPVEVTDDLLAQMKGELAHKREVPALADVRLESLTEGTAAQILHVGPYSAEGPTIAALHAFIEAQGLGFTHKHHEIYLGDPHRAAPEKLRTIIRQPVSRQS